MRHQRVPAACAIARCVRGLPCTHRAEAETASRSSSAQAQPLSSDPRAPAIMLASPQAPSGRRSGGRRVLRPRSGALNPISNPTEPPSHGPQVGNLDRPDLYGPWTGPLRFDTAKPAHRDPRGRLADGVTVGLAPTDAPPLRRLPKAGERSAPMITAGLAARPPPSKSLRQTRRPLPLLPSNPTTDQRTARMDHQAAAPRRLLLHRTLFAAVRRATALRSPALRHQAQGPPGEYLAWRAPRGAARQNGM